MFCPQCGAKIADGGRFCPACGTPVTPNAVIAGDPAPYSDPWTDQMEPARPQYSAPQKHTGRGPLIAAVALVLVVVMVAAIIISSLAGGPMVKIASALQKTVDKGNLTAEFEISLDGESVEGIAMVDIDREERKVLLYCELEADGMEYVYGIYDGYMVMMVEYYGETYYDCEDISDELDEMFDAYEENTEEFDMQELLDTLDEGSGGELSDIFDFDELETCLTAYAKKLNSESWLKENAGYSKSSKNGVTFYTFEPSLYDFAEASLPFLESAFEDSDDYDDMMDELEDSEDYMEDYEIVISIGLRSGCLSELKAEFDMDGDVLEISGQITDIGKTQIDVELLEEMLDEAQ